MGIKADAAFEVTVGWGGKSKRVWVPANERVRLRW